MGEVTHIHAIQSRRSERVAVLLNANAKAVSRKVVREIERFVPPEDVYLSRSFDDARSIVGTVLDRGYTTLLTGGGDGTFVGYVNELRRELHNREGQRFTSHGGAALRLAPAPAKLPRFGTLALGTGNALARLSGASLSRVGIVEDILRVRTGDVAHSRSIHLVNAEGKSAPFAGMGIDAKVLNDYVGLKKSVAGTPLAPLGLGLGAYLTAVATKTVPHYLFSRTVPQVVVRNVGAPAQQIAPDGRPVGAPIETGDILYQGPCRIAAVGTVPQYGYGFTIFPHALDAPGRMQLRLTAMPTMEILRHLPAIWKGRTPRAGILDFFVDRIQMEFDRKMPFQIGGDAEGYRDSVEIGVDDSPVELIDFKPRG